MQPTVLRLLVQCINHLSIEKVIILINADLKKYSSNGCYIVDSWSYFKLIIKHQINRNRYFQKFINLFKTTNQIANQPGGVAELAPLMYDSFELETNAGYVYHIEKFSVTIHS
jgi:hypothetical protein